MDILITALLTFVVVLCLTTVLGVLSVFTASVVGRTFPRARETCQRCTTGWKTRRGLRNRLLLTPFCITLALFLALAVLGSADTHRVRASIIDGDRLIVRSGGNCHRKPDQERILFETEEKKEIRALADRLSLDLLAIAMQCRCCGEMTFDLYRGQELRYTFSLHHGDSIRVSGASWGDRRLTLFSQARLSTWLDRAGITARLEEASKEQEARWEMEFGADAGDSDGGEEQEGEL